MPKFNIVSRHVQQQFKKLKELDIQVQRLAAGKGLATYDQAAEDPEGALLIRRMRDTAKAILTLVEYAKDKKDGRYLATEGITAPEVDASPLLMAEVPSTQGGQVPIDQAGLLDQGALARVGALCRHLIQLKDHDLTGIDQLVQDSFNRRVSLPPVQGIDPAQANQAVPAVPLLKDEAPVGCLGPFLDAAVTSFGQRVAIGNKVDQLKYLSAMQGAAADVFANALYEVGTVAPQQAASSAAGQVHEAQLALIFETARDYRRRAYEIMQTVANPSEARRKLQELREEAADVGKFKARMALIGGRTFTDDENEWSDQILVHDKVTSTLHGWESAQDELILFRIEQGLNPEAAEAMLLAQRAMLDSKREGGLNITGASDAQLEEILKKMKGVTIENVKLVFEERNGALSVKFDSDKSSRAALVGVLQVIAHAANKVPNASGEQLNVEIWGMNTRKGRTIRKTSAVLALCAGLEVRFDHKHTGVEEALEKCKFYTNPHELLLEINKALKGGEGKQGLLYKVAKGGFLRLDVESGYPEAYKLLRVRIETAARGYLEKIHKIVDSRKEDKTDAAIVREVVQTLVTTRGSRTTDQEVERHFAVDILRQEVRLLNAAVNEGAPQAVLINMVYLWKAMEQEGIFTDAHTHEQILKVMEGLDAPARTALLATFAAVNQKLSGTPVQLGVLEDYGITAEALPGQVAASAAQALGLIGSDQTQMYQQLQTRLQAGVAAPAPEAVAGIQQAHTKARQIDPANPADARVTERTTKPSIISSIVGH